MKHVIPQWCPSHGKKAVLKKETQKGEKKPYIPDVFILRYENYYHLPDYPCISSCIRWPHCYFKRISNVQSSEYHKITFAKQQCITVTDVTQNKGCCKWWQVCTVQSKWWFQVYVYICTYNLITHFYRMFMNMMRTTTVQREIHTVQKKNSYSLSRNNPAYAWIGRQKFKTRPQPWHEMLKFHPTFFQYHTLCQWVL